MKAIEIMKLGDVLHELSNTSDCVLNVIRVLRGIPGKDHDEDVDALYRVYDEICSEMERLAGGITYEQKTEEKTDEAKRTINNVFGLNKTIKVDGKCDIHIDIDARVIAHKYIKSLSDEEFVELFRHALKERLR